MGIGLGEDGNQDVTGIHLFFAATLHMTHRSLQHPVKGDGLGRLTADLFHDRHPGFEKPFQTVLDIVIVAPTLVDDVTGKLVMEQTVEHMLDGNVFVVMILGFFDRLNQGEFQFSTQHNVIPRGRCRASPCSSDCSVSALDPGRFSGLSPVNISTEIDVFLPCGGQ
jgi:hypothetical protein